MAAVDSCLVVVKWDIEQGDDLSPGHYLSDQMPADIQDTQDIGCRNHQSWMELGEVVRYPRREGNIAYCNYHFRNTGYCLLLGTPVENNLMVAAGVAEVAEEDLAVEGYNMPTYPADYNQRGTTLLLKMNGEKNRLVRYNYTVFGKLLNAMKTIN